MANDAEDKEKEEEEKNGLRDSIVIDRTGEFNGGNGNGSGNGKESNNEIARSGNGRGGGNGTELGTWIQVCYPGRG